MRKSLYLVNGVLLVTILVLACKDEIEADSTGSEGNADTEESPFIRVYNNEIDVL